MAPASSPAAERALAPVTPWRAGTEAAASTAITATTMTSSMSVYPLAPGLRRRMVSLVDDVGVLGVSARLAVAPVALDVEGVGVELPGIEVDVLVAPGILHVLALAGLDQLREPLLGGGVAPLLQLVEVEAVLDGVQVGLGLLHLGVGESAHHVHGDRGGDQAEDHHHHHDLDERHAAFRSAAPGVAAHVQPPARVLIWRMGMRMEKTTKATIAPMKTIITGSSSE